MEVITEKTSMILGKKRQVTEIEENSNQHKNNNNKHTLSMCKSSQPGCF